MAFKFKKQRRVLSINVPSFDSQRGDVEQELLTGQVRGMKASAPEERLAKALDKNGTQYEFRYIVGAPKGMPGWKELDFLIASGGLIYALEVDTAFTHRMKQNSDILHDAIILNDREIQTFGELYPKVTHVDGDSDLVDQESANKFVKNNFIKSGER